MQISRSFILAPVLASLAMTASGATILSANGYKTNEFGDFLFDQSVEKTPASTADSVKLPTTPLLTVSSRFGILSVLASVNTNAGAESFGQASFTDVITASMAGTIRIPIIIFGGVTESYSGLNGDLEVDMAFLLENTQNGASAEAVRRYVVNLLEGVRGEADEVFETPGGPGVAFNPLSGNGGYYESEIDIPVVAGENVIRMSLTGRAACFPTDGLNCQLNAEFDKTLYLGAASFFNVNGGLEDLSQIVTSESGLNYARGTLVDRQIPGQVPEPSTVALAAAGLAAMAWLRRRAA